MFEVRLFYASQDDGFGSNARKKGIIISNGQFFRFHLIPYVASPSSSPPPIVVSLDFIYNSFISLNLCYVCMCS
jgi:hypothetical protein